MASRLFLVCSHDVQGVLKMRDGCIGVVMGAEGSRAQVSKVDRVK